MVVEKGSNTTIENEDIIETSHREIEWELQKVQGISHVAQQTHTTSMVTLKVALMAQDTTHSKGMS